MADPLVSVVVPCFNAAPYAGALIESVLGQTFGDFELLLADDGSSDGTAAVLERYQGDRRVRLARWEGNRGVTAATLTLLAQARGAYWCYPGADDLLDPVFLERRLRRLEARPDAVWAAGPGRLIDGEGKAIEGVRLAPELPSELAGARLLELLLQHNVINTPSVMIRMEATRRVLPRLSARWRYAQDWALWLLLAAAGGTLLYDEERLHSYRMHAGSLTRDPTKAAVREAEVRLVPLCALAAAAGLSATAAAVWRRRGHALYCLWLRRALSLRARGMLDPAWMGWAAEAWRGANPGAVSLGAEAARHAVCLLAHTWRERQARRRQGFAVSGLAQVDDPVFRA